MPTDAFTRETLKPRSTEGILTLVTITHDELPEPVRLVDNTEDVVGPGGETWIARNVAITLPADFSEGEPRGTLVVDNVLRDLIDAIRSTSSAPTTQIDFVSISDPTTVQHGPFLFQWGQARYSELGVEVDLLVDDFLNDAYPGYRFDPKTTPGAF